jgi:signal transduction histidine kinase
MPNIRQRLLTPFRTLGWKLTLSYTLVTVAALLVVEIILLLVVLGIIQNPGFWLLRLAADAMLTSAPEAARFLEQTPPDRNGLESWLMNASVNGFAVNETDTTSEGQFTPAALSEGDGVIFVVDTQRNILVSAPNEKTPPDWPEADPVIATALSGVTAAEKLYALNDARQTVIAVPIQNANGKTLGALVYAGTLIQTNNGGLGDIPSLLAGSALFFTIAAGIIGTIFGLITSRGLVRRLKAVSQAADAWSQGNFSITIQDQAKDELGQLAIHLNEMSEQLKTLLQTRQELASLEERNRLARELHDSVKQQVFATVMQVGAARELLTENAQSAETHLNEAERLARLAQQELTVLIRELRPAALEGRGLTTALRDYLTNWSQQSNIQFDLRVQGERPLPLAVEQALYRVAQEALSNIARHSAATRVDVRLAWQDGQFSLTISDNGRGFNPETDNSKGVGLHSMRERVEGLGGTLSLESSSNGTKIEITSPI